MNKKNSTSWGKVGKWYDQLVGSEGMYFHKNIILPKVLGLLDFEKYQQPALLDVGCGQGVLSRQIPKNVEYSGVDISSKLIQQAEKHRVSQKHQFFKGDAIKPLPVKKEYFTHATVILALQNMEDPSSVIKNVGDCLVENGKLILVMNHPCFRIPRQTHWGIDEEKKIQYRRLDRYMSSLKIPIHAKPSKGEKSEITWSFHHPLSLYVQWLSQSNLLLSHMEEWCSDKISSGSKAKMENKSREEFPMFLCCVAIKK